MSDLNAIEYKRFEDIKHIREDGSEYWSARELGPALDYAKWDNFSKVIKRAMVACENSGHSVSNDFPEVRKIVEAGATSKPKKDYELSRYACYLIVQNGDPVSYTHLDVYKRQHITHASSHFVIGLEGEIVQCIPCDEIAYASNDRNSDTIAIECCIPDDTGKFNDQTYQSLVQLVTWLMGRYDLGVEDVIRHYDVTGKNCPKYFVEHTCLLYTSAQTWMARTQIWGRRL